MLYQPKYCCNCGEKVDRQKWGIFTSRRFCEICEDEFKLKENVFKIAFVSLGLIGMAYGFGSYLQKPQKPLQISSNQVAFVSANKPQNFNAPLPPSSGNAQNFAARTNANQTVEKIIAAPDTNRAQNLRVLKGNDSRAETKPEAVYYCGAQTKKGTPCTRRVKGGGRCWQHTGQPALLPPEKLLIGQ